MVHRSIDYWSSLLRNSLSIISQVRQAHGQVIAKGLLPDVTVETDLVLAYSKCGSLHDARKVFDKMTRRSMHSWNILIASYVQGSMYCDAMNVFLKLLKMGFRPDHYTLPPLFKASAQLGDAWAGEVLHVWVLKLGFQDYIVVGGSLLDFLVKCGNLKDAWDAFCSMSWRDSVAWNSMFTGLVRAGFYVTALDLFRKMLQGGGKMNSMIIPTILNACGREGDLIRGKEIHGHIVKSFGISGDVAIGNALVDMYSKCGCLYNSEKIFTNMQESNLVTWTTMISCYGLHGKGEQSLMMFQKMKNHGLKPNPVTLTAILASCSHSCLLKQGWEIFNSMALDYGVEPSTEHYACIVDLLGRCGYLDEALGVIKNMKVVAAASVWGALLSSCVIHKNVEIGEVAAHHLFNLEPRNCSNYIALCSIYESHAMWDGVSMIRTKMRELGLEKSPGCSWINIAGKVHTFYQGDLSHPMSHTIYETLDGIINSDVL